MLRDKSKASQGGIDAPQTIPTRARFSKSQSQNTEETAGANQLHKCHRSLVKCRIYITPESVAHLSHITIRQESSVAKMFYRISCRNVTVARMSYPLQKCFVKWQICHVAEMSHLGPNRTYRPRITPTDGK